MPVTSNIYAYLQCSNMSSKELLELPTAGNHYVQLYQKTAQLADAVGHFIGDKLSETEGIIIVATPLHTAAFCETLTSAGHDIDEWVATGKLTLLDANTLLSSFLVDGMPNAQLFLKSVEPILRKVFKQYSSARIYGEMVNLLWLNDEKKGAIALEKLWNALLKDYNFSLLCAYAIDNLNPLSYTHAFDCVCDTHTHLLPPQEPALFERVILNASKELTSVNMAEMIYSSSKLGHPTTLMPAAQASLFHLSKTAPLALEKILGKVKANFNKIHELSYSHSLNNVRDIKSADKLAQPQD